MSSDMVLAAVEATAALGNVSFFRGWASLGTGTRLRKTRS
jgi:hypothetical protein